MQSLSLPKSVSYNCLQKRIDIKYENTGLVLRYNPWQGCSSEFAGIFYKEDREIIDRATSFRDHLREFTTELDKRALGRLETLGGRMSSHEDRYAVPHFDFHFSFDIWLVLYGIAGLFKTDQFVLYLVVNHLWWFWCFVFFFFLFSFLQYSENQ